MIEFLTNTNILEYSMRAWSSAIMVVMIFALLFMLNRSQKKYLDTIDKYSLLIEKQIQTNVELNAIVSYQNKKIEEIFNHIKK